MKWTNNNQTEKFLLSSGVSCFVLKACDGPLPVWFFWLLPPVSCWIPSPVNSSPVISLVFVSCSVALPVCPCSVFSCLCHVSSGHPAAYGLICAAFPPFCSHWSFPCTTLKQNKPQSLHLAHFCLLSVFGSLSNKHNKIAFLPLSVFSEQ